VASLQSQVASLPKHKPLPSVPKDAAAVLLARVLGNLPPPSMGGASNESSSAAAAAAAGGEKVVFSYPATNGELQILGVQVRLQF